MRKRETVIWQSKVFPEMQVTDLMRDVFRTAYKNLKHFEPELRKAEAWLVTHPDRIPRRNWRAFINSWMRNANAFAVQDRERRASGKSYWQPEPRDNTKSTPKLIGDLMKEMADAPSD